MHDKTPRYVRHRSMACPETMEIDVEMGAITLNAHPTYPHRHTHLGPKKTYHCTVSWHNSAGLACEEFLLCRIPVNFYSFDRSCSYHLTPWPLGMVSKQTSPDRKSSSARHGRVQHACWGLLQCRGKVEGEGGGREGEGVERGGEVGPGSWAPPCYS